MTAADTKSQWEAAEQMLKRQAKKRRRPETLGGDKGYDTKGFVGMLQKRQIAPHIAANDKRRGGSAVDKQIRKRKGYAISQRVRKRIEEIFGWMKTIGGLRKTRHKGRARTQLTAGEVWSIEWSPTASEFVIIAPDLGGTLLCRRVG